MSGKTLHSAVTQAVFMSWNNQSTEADAFLEEKHQSHPRWALEWANNLLVKGLMQQSNKQREAVLERMQGADNLAVASKYTAPMDLEENEDDDEMLEAASEDISELSEKERAKLMKLKEEHMKAQREKDKAAFKKAQKEAGKTGQTLNNAWKMECEIVYADALLVRSMLQLAMNSYLKGGINLRKTWGCYHALMQEIEKDTTGSIPKENVLSVKYGCGVFYMYLALVPAGLMRVLSAIGFVQEKELGEQYLMEVMASDHVRSPFAALVLLTYYLFLPTGLGNVKETLAKAKKILDMMNEKYPNNSYFNGYANFYHRKLGNTKEAVQAITKATNFAEAGGNMPTLLRYLLADTLYMDLQFENAKTKYLELLDYLEQTKETFTYTGQVVISLSACYAMLGEPAKALEWLKKVNNMYNPKSKQDSNSPKYAARVLSEPKLLPLIGVYVLYINRDLAHMNADHVDKLKAVMVRVTEGQDMASSYEVRGMKLLFEGVMAKNCGRTEEASALFQEVFDFEKKLSSSSLVLPYLYYEAGEMEYRAGNFVRAQKLLETGCGLKGDGHETLANRYSIAKKQIKKEMKEKGLA